MKSYFLQILLSKVLILFTTSFIGGHGVSNFGINLVYAFSFLLVDFWIVLSALFYVLIFLITLFYKGASTTKIINVNNVTNLISYSFYMIFAFGYRVDFLLLVLTSLPFLLHSIYLFKKYSRN